MNIPKESLYLSELFRHGMDTIYIATLPMGNVVIQVPFQDPLIMSPSDAAKVAETLAYAASVGEGYLEKMRKLKGVEA